MNHYAPLHELLILAEWKLMGASSLGFRLISILLQWATAIACWRMLFVLTKREFLAFGIALLWAAHPEQSEAVAWIVEQKTLLCGVFSFMALAVFMDTEHARFVRTLAATSFMLIAWGGKAHAFVVAPIAVLFEVFVNRSSAEPLMRRIAWTLPLCALAVVVGVTASKALSYSDLGEISNWTFRDTLTNLPGTLAIYLRVAFLPWTASFYHDMDRIVSFSDPAFFLTLLILLATFVALLVIAPANQRCMTAFCALVWIVGIGPMLNISKWTMPAYDRYQYFALPFLLLGSALSVEHLLHRVSDWTAATTVQTARPALWIGALGLTGTLGFLHGRLYRDECLVMQDAAEKAPRSCYPHLALCNALIYYYWIPAMHEGSEAQQRELAARIKVAALEAQKHWNFAEFHPTAPAIVLSVAHVMQFTHMPEDARFFARMVIDTKWWYPIPGERAEAEQILAQIDAATASP
jgi:hypothetical protein